MNLDDLRDQLSEAGRRPVPEPRAEFVETLLARMQLQGEVGHAAVIPLAERSLARRLQLPAAAAVAAALLVAFGAVATLRQPQVSTATLSAISSETKSLDGTVNKDGTLATETPDGRYEAHCVRGGRVPTTGAAYECKTGEKVVLDVVGGAVVSITGAGPPATAPGDLADSFALTRQTSGRTLTLSWPETAASGAAGYVVLRTSSNDAEVRPPLPQLPADKVADIALGTPSYVETFDGNLLPETQIATYRVAVVDGRGNVLAISSPLTLRLSLN
jgi:hypothetical protein